MAAGDPNDSTRLLIADSFSEFHKFSDISLKPQALQDLKKTEHKHPAVLNKLNSTSSRKLASIRIKTSRNRNQAENDERLQDTFRVDQIVNPSALIKDNIQHLNAE